MSAHDMTTGGRSPHMPGGLDAERIVDDGSHEPTGGHTADLAERDPLMGEAPMNDSTERSGGVEPPD